MRRRLYRVEGYRLIRREEQLVLEQRVLEEIRAEAIPTDPQELHYYVSEKLPVVSGLLL